MAPSLLQLDWDVTSQILAQIEPLDALHLALTNRTFHRVAIPRFLSEVTIGSEWQKDGRNRVDKFSRYMLRRPAERIPYLRILIIESDAFVTGTADPATGETYVDFNFTAAVPLASVVQRASRLRKLHVGGSDFLFGSVPELAAAIASLTSIQEFKMMHVGTTAERVLSRMRSRPRTVECSIFKVRDRQETRRHTGFIRGQHHLLHNFTDSLEVLNLENVGDILSRIEPGTVWPCVRDLTIVDEIVVDLNSFGRAFPNVRRLRVSAVSIHPVEISDLWANLDFLALHWPRYHIFRRVRWVRFNLSLVSGRNHGNTMRYSEARHFLSVTKPAILDGFGTPELFQCIAESVPTLKFLRVFVTPTFSGSSSRQVNSLDDWLGKITPHLKQISLRGLAVVTQCQALESRDRYAQLILASNAGIEYVGLATMNMNPLASWADDVRSYAWYRIAARPQNGPPVVEALRDGLGNAAFQSLLDTPSL
ncbi:hypothetical protein DAEQUDRAFT_729557 [Daedalea quercina L-15889]|uniref:F-box domain-containing protein n=1 Tax=Daedalea quercina L-15889 TaxID=1314783 RepID=A0A165NM01_9APHY|nr:hypothetical protein DAEQUDRAFT_729557 [Daedalea quercina L-15889]